MSGEDILRSGRTETKIDPSGSTVETLKENISVASTKLQEAASRKGHELREQGKDLIGQQKDELAVRIGGIGSAVKRAAFKLRESDDIALADATEGIASKIDNAAAYVRDHDIGEMLQDAEDFTKRHASLVLGGLFVGGVVLARFLKASRPMRSPEPGPIGQEMLFDQDDDLDLGGNIYEEPRFEETPLGDAHFGGAEPHRPGGLEAEGFGKPQETAAKMPESDIGARDRSEVGVNVGRTQAPPPVTSTSYSSWFEQRTDERFDDRDGSGRKI